MKRFVIQQHTTTSDVHWDFMLEQEKHLLTWRLPLPPEKLLHQSSPAIKIFNHNLKFLTYQGPVNKGTGRVQIADEGTYSLLNIQPELIRIHLQGKHIKGIFTIRMIHNNQWSLATDNLTCPAPDLPSQ
ncbi:MAG: DNA polymerase ligase N-terminal domain-containing protein [Planctomycetota bacterium]